MKNVFYGRNPNKEALNHPPYYIALYIQTLQRRRYNSRNKLIQAV